jgi:uncharacterized Zn ribbon protein
MSHSSRWSVWIAAALLIAAALACSVEFSTAHFENAALFQDANGDTRTRAFKTGDTIYCITDLKDVGGQALPLKMELVRIVTHEDGTREEISVASETRESRNDRLVFRLTPPADGWARGDYQVWLFLDGEKKQALDLKIK